MTRIEKHAENLDKMVDGEEETDGVIAQFACDEIHFSNAIRIRLLNIIFHLSPSISDTSM